jgi:hypothetical protein
VSTEIGAHTLAAPVLSASAGGIGSHDHTSLPVRASNARTKPCGMLACTLSPIALPTITRSSEDRGRRREIDLPDTEIGKCVDIDGAVVAKVRAQLAGERIERNQASVDHALENAS